MQVTRISHAIRQHLPTIEAMEPIRRGDVVQIDPTGSMGCRPKTHVVTGVSEDGFVGLHNAPPVPISFVARIGRARYYPDGTPVEG